MPLKTLEPGTALSLKILCKTLSVEVSIPALQGTWDAFTALNFQKLSNGTISDNFQLSK